MASPPRHQNTSDFDTRILLTLWGKEYLDRNITYIYTDILTCSQNIQSAQNILALKQENHTSIQISNFSVAALVVLGKQASAPDPPQGMPAHLMHVFRLRPKRRKLDAAHKIQAQVKITKQNHFFSLKPSPPQPHL